MSTLLKTLITSCGRPDLLETTLSSLLNNQKERLQIVIHEEKLYTEEFAKKWKWWVQLGYTGGVGQHNSIAQFVENVQDKYYLHVEDDWEFNNTFNWIKKAKRILQKNPDIIKVVARGENVHPCQFKDGWGIIEPQDFYGNTWYGWTWNPGVTRLDLLKQFQIRGVSEKDMDNAIHEAGYKVAYLEGEIYKHIGNERSTRL